MKKKILAVLLVSAMFVLVACGSSAIYSGHNVRNSDWGDSMEDVKAAESIEVENETANRLLYNDKFLDYDARISYIFLQDELGEVDFNIYPDDSNDIDSIYSTVDKKLEGAYGKATADYDTFKCYGDKESDIWVSKESTYVSIKFGIKLENLTNQ